MPGVAESALVGVPIDFGEVGVAVVIAKPGAKLDADAIVAQLKSQLANLTFKKCFVVAELPRNTMGKVQKNLLRISTRGCLLDGWRPGIQARLGGPRSAQASECIHPRNFRFA